MGHPVFVVEVPSLWWVTRREKRLLEDGELVVGGGGEVGLNFVCYGFADYGEEGVWGGLLDAADAAEVLYKALAGAGAYAGDGVQL